MLDAVDAVLVRELQRDGRATFQALADRVGLSRTAVRARFGNDAGTLLKTTDIGCVDQVEYDDGPPNPATELFAAWLAEAPASFPGGWYARTDQAIHLDSLLRQEALRELEGIVRGRHLHEVARFRMVDEVDRASAPARTGTQHRRDGMGLVDAQHLSA